MTVAWLSLAATPAEAPKPLYWVDLEQALEALPESKIVARRLKIEKARRQAVIDDARQKLEGVQAKLSQVEYGRRAEAIDAMVQEAERALDQKQQAWLSPVVARLTARIARAPVRTVTLQAVPLVTPIPECDRTAWLVSVETGKPAPKVNTKCVFRGLLEIDVNVLLAELPETKESQARLRAFVQSVQDKMDFERQKLRQLERSRRGQALGDAWALRKAALDSRFEQAQAQVDRRRQDEESRLYDVLARRLEELVKGHAGVAFVDVGSQVDVKPRCAVSEWAKSRLASKGPQASARSKALWPAACTFTDAL